MTAEDHLLCICARQEFSSAHQEAAETLCRTQEVRWHRVLAAAERHGVLPIVGANLRRCDLALPEEVGGRLEIAILENAALKERDADRLATALGWLREVKLDTLLLKGTALDLLVYDEPWVAFSRDIDLSLRPQPGWRKGEGQERQIRRALYTHGIECDLDGHHDLTLNGALPLDFDRIWRQACPVRFRGAEAWVMSPEDLLVSLCLNLCRKRFFRLKGLFDVAETLRRQAPFDPARLANLAREGRCEGVVYAALIASQDLLGAGPPPEMLRALPLSRPRRILIRRLVAVFQRSGSFTGPAGRSLGLLLIAASLRPAELSRFFRYGLTRRPLKRKAPLELPGGRPRPALTSPTPPLPEGEEGKRKSLFVLGFSPLSPSGREGPGE